MYKLFLILLIISSCSFQNPDGSQKSKINHFKLDTQGDTDGDLLPNGIDPDPALADVPFFDGQMIEEVKIDARFYNRHTDKFTNSEMLVRSDDENIVLRKGMSYLKALVEDATAYTSSTNAYFAREIHSSFIDMYSAPIITDAAAHNFMAFASDFETQGFVLDSVEFEVRNRINLKSERFKNFRDIIFDIYFYDYQSKKLEFLDTFKNVGSFEFNKDHNLDMTNIQTRNTRIMDNSVLKTGRFLYVKIKDFYIPEIQTSYSDLMNGVRIKSVPFIINAPDSFEVSYVGLNGGHSNILPIFKSSLKTDFEVDNNRFIKYKDYPVGEYRVEDSEGNRTNVESRWLIVTNMINNNPFSYSFLPSDVIFLNYTKSNDPAYYPQKVVSGFSDTNKRELVKGENLLPQSLRKFKIIISSLIAIQPVLQQAIIRKNDCGTALSRDQTNTYGRTSVSFQNEVLLANDSRLEALLTNTSLEIDGFEYPLQKLLTDKKFSISVNEESQIVLESNDSFLKSIRGLGEEAVRFSIIHNRQDLMIQTGDKMIECMCKVCGGYCGRDNLGCERLKAVREVPIRNHYPLNYTFYTSVFIF